MLSSHCYYYDYRCAERTVATLRNIGPAVFNGGLSTFLAFVLLANSSSYGFTVFFRVRTQHVLGETCADEDSDYDPDREDLNSQLNETSLQLNKDEDETDDEIE